MFSGNCCGEVYQLGAPIEFDRNVDLKLQTPNMKNNRADGQFVSFCSAFVIALVFLSTLLVTFVPTQAFARTSTAIALDVRVSGDENASRIIVDFDRPIEGRPQLLEHPWRLVLDFDRIAFGFDPKPDQWTGLVRDLRWGDMSDINSRIIFEMEKPFRIANITNVENAETNTHRIIVDLVLSDAETFKAALIDRMRTSAVVNREAKSGRLGVSGPAPVRSGEFRVVLDPGHGGIDTGAIGQKRTIEKAITLAFAKQLKTELETRAGLDVILTRDNDVFIPLNDRVQFARQHNADLFISIHADSVREKYVRGATVYTISEKASDSVAAQIAESENKSDAIAGLTFEDEPEDVSDILIDLARRETLGFSVQIARLAVDSLGKDVRMIKNPHRFAGFRVLRAPDVPSVLVELGFLSNLEDEKLLNQADWRAKVARSISDAVAQFAALSGREIAGKRQSE